MWNMLNYLFWEAQTDKISVILETTKYVRTNLFIMMLLMFYVAAYIQRELNMLILSIYAINF